MAGWNNASYLGAVREASLADAYRTIPVRGSGWRRILSFLGPGFVIAVGYMDPGNWATSIAGGSQFGYALLSIVLISNLMAILLQSLCARLGIGSGRDLAQACRDAFPRYISLPLWVLAEIAICATDLAEVIGTAIAFNLLFHIPLEIGVIITALDVFLILWLQRKGFRRLEAFVILLLLVIALSFFLQIALADPVWGDVVRGFAPTTEIVFNSDMLYLGLGIIGATVMPHNLYLHSSIVQTRAYGDSTVEKKQALKFANLDTGIALSFAFLINASILIVAGSFHHSGYGVVEELDKAHALLSPLLGSDAAPYLFGVALLCCGLNSTITATLAGQIVMEGFIAFKLTPWLRRLITRGIAIVPAAAATIYYGSTGAGKLLIFSQVVLSLQLPFAVIPLILFTASKAKMGEMKAPVWVTLTGAVIALILVILNAKMIADVLIPSSGSGG